MRALAYVLCLAGCNAITGVDDYQFGTGAGAGATTGTASTVSGTTGTMSTSGAGGCGPNTKVCGDVCAALDDPAFGCNLATCDPCAAGDACCPGCFNVVNNPTACGSCTNTCHDTEWCTGTSCTCRPGLVPSGSGCVDPLSNPNDCGGNGPCGGGMPLCQNGVCVSACGGGTQECDGGCVDTSSDPLHCGGCDPCDSDRVCSGGDCVGFQFGDGCTSCPCAACTGDYDLCCMAGSTPICLKDASSCP